MKMSFRVGVAMTFHLHAFSGWRFREPRAFPNISPRGELGAAQLLPASRVDDDKPLECFVIEKDMGEPACASGAWLFRRQNISLLRNQLKCAYHVLL